MRFAFIFLLFASTAFAESNFDHNRQTNDIFNTVEIIKFINNHHHIKMLRHPKSSQEKQRQKPAPGRTQDFPRSSP